LLSWKKKSKGNRLPNRREALEILREAGCSEDVIEHSLAVCRVALRLARQLKKKGFPVDLRLVEAGGLLHDLGRSETHHVKHGYIGGEIARKLGLPSQLIKIIERHVGGGITAEEAKLLGMPARNFIPETLEEKIVAYADKLIARNRTVNFEETLQEFREKLGENHPALERLKKLREEIEGKLRDP